MQVLRSRTGLFPHVRRLVSNGEKSMKATFVSQPLARREFLRISSTAVIGIAASGLINPKALVAATTAGSAAFQPLLSIGYAPALVWGDGSMALTSADRNLSPDPLFIARGARV